ncbi:MAG TPA: MAPEG family protein [Rhodanobacteraceae bacterium]|nr:MAPEG family protein [Rhodanobacteraceae bacterium]
MPISSLFVALAVLLVLLLAIRVALRRNVAAIGLGDGGDAELARRIRAHGNAVEYLPLALLELALLEHAGTSAALLYALGGTLIVARVLHAIGLSRSGGRSAGRVLGMLGTWLAMLAMALLLLWQATHV